ncbi:MAG: Holliday junction branch migration protein RuvA [Firmicutes bacterium]|nr:Holliday junction branch migration protein RuvA [Bacillota bacterium]
MIYQLTGKTVFTSPGFAVIDVNGVGYGVNIPDRLIGTTVTAGNEVTLHTVTILRQDDISLFGFISGMDREFFRMLINIPRIGPKGALKILSSAASVQLMQLILSGDKKSLAKIPGVGAKVSDRLILELQEKVKKTLDESGEECDDIFEEAVEVLLGLGCSVQEAREVLAKVREASGKDETDFDNLLNEALKIMAEMER